MTFNTMIHIAGVDEVGRGALAGPVMAAAVILDPNKPIAGLMDSKQLTPKKREILCLHIQENALAYALGSANIEEIDRLNILHASLLAMRRAVQALPIIPHKILCDGLYCPPGLNCEAEAVVKGDQKIAAISAASILAKVTRDRLMCELGELYPEYAFARHKGYGTAVHQKALKKWGPCTIHRRSFTLHGAS